MAECAVLIPFGPSQQELDRVADLLDSLWRYEPRARWVVLVDDHQGDRNLREQFKVPEGCELVRLVNPYAGKTKPGVITKEGPLCIKTLLGLAWIEANTQAQFVARLDTDALVIAPFAHRLGHYFAAHPEVGMVSAYERSCNGRPRGWARWARTIKRLRSPIRVGINNKRPYLDHALDGPRAKIRALIGDALANGYTYGENCFGGATAIAAETLRRMRARGYFDDLDMWLNVRMADDAMMGIYVRAVGMKLADMGEGEVFGARQYDLPDHPELLLARGFAIIHSVKGYQDLGEEEIRSFFQRHRSAPDMVTGGAANAFDL